MSRIATLEFQIKRGVVDIDSSDHPIKGLLEESLRLSEEGKFEDAIGLIFPHLNFEWIWSNCDSDPQEIFDNTDDIFSELTEENSSIKIGVIEGQLAITATVQFYVQVKNGVESEVISRWLEENCAYSCGHISGGWSYSGSDGDNVWLVMVN